MSGFQSTLPVRGATRVAEVVGAVRADISIHAPRAGSDEYARSDLDKRMTISIHAPRAGSDGSTAWHIWRSPNFNPRSPCGERLFLGMAKINHKHFNPRSPCGERLACRVPFISPPSVFQSTLPVRGATTWTGEGQLAYQIFQSTLPVRGATMTIPPSPWLPTAFQSTLPVRGATAMVAAGIFHRAISIHAPRAGSDGEITLYEAAEELFQSTLPVRGATGQMLVYRCNYGFQSTLPVRGATANSLKRAHNDTFQSTLPVRGATSYRHLYHIYYWYFNPRSPCGERPMLHSGKCH